MIVRVSTTCGIVHLIDNIVWGICVELQFKDAFLGVACAKYILVVG